MFLTSTLAGSGWLASRPGCFAPRERDWEEYVASILMSKRMEQVESYIQLAASAGFFFRLLFDTEDEI
jgi:hypothetical protein